MINIVLLSRRNTILFVNIVFLEGQLSEASAGLGRNHETEVALRLEFNMTMVIPVHSDLKI